MERSKIKDLYIKIKADLCRFFPWFIAAVTVMSSHLAADPLWKLLESIYDPNEHVERFTLWLAMVHTLFFLFMVWLLFYEKERFFKPLTRHLEEKSPEAKKHLILLLSQLPSKGGYKNGIPPWLDLSYNLEDDIKKMEALKEEDFSKRWQWEMPLRAILYHLKKNESNKSKLETVTLICSPESVSQIHWFKDICMGYDELKELTLYIYDSNSRSIDTITSAEYSSNSGWKFEDFNLLSDGIWRLFEIMKKKKHFCEKDIIIDFTGGQKVTSVVAATMTFNRKIKSQYIQTEKPWNVLGYDVVKTSGDTGEFGL